MTVTTPTKPSDTAQRPSMARNVLDGVGVTNVSILIALAAVLIAIAFINTSFFQPRNLVVIGTSIAIMGLLAVVQTVVIIVGGLDISVGSVAGLASGLSGMVFTATASNAGASVLAALAIGVAAGLVNGAIIVYGRVNPVIATLGTLAAYKGVAQVITDGRGQGYVSSDAFFTFLARGTVLGIPTLIWVLLLVAAAMHVLLTYTDIGRKIYAIGGNDTASRLAGININRYILATFALSGLVAGIAGILITAKVGYGDPVQSSEGLELEAITAAALGGAALKGGKGSIVSTLLAVLLLGVLLNGMTLVGIDPFWQNVARGALLVVAVVLQQLRSGERRVGMPQ